MGRKLMSFLAELLLKNRYRQALIKTISGGFDRVALNRKSGMFQKP